MSTESIVWGWAANERIGRHTAQFAKRLKQSMLARLEDNPILGKEDFAQAGRLSLRLHAAEPGSEECDELIGGLHRNDLFTAVASTWEKFLELVKPELLSGEGEDPGPAIDAIDEPDGNDQQDGTEETGDRGESSPLRRKLKQIRVDVAERQGAKPPQVAEVIGEPVDADGSGQNPYEDEQASTTSAGPGDGPSIVLKPGEAVSSGKRKVRVRNGASSATAVQAEPLMQTVAGDLQEQAANAEAGDPATRRNAGKAKASTPSSGNTLPEEGSRNPEYWAGRINRHLSRCVESFVAAGKELDEAQNRLHHGDWMSLFDSGLVGISLREAERLMCIARHPTLSDSTNWSNLPSSERALSVLTRIPPADLETALKEQKITSASTIQEAEAVVKGVLGRSAGQGAEGQADAFDAEKAVAQCLKTIKKALEAAGKEHREALLAKLVETIAGLRGSANEP